MSHHCMLDQFQMLNKQRHVDSLKKLKGNQVYLLWLTVVLPSRISWQK